MLLMIGLFQSICEETIALFLDYQRKEARKMAIRIAVGDENFDEIRKAGLYYVDKTELLYDLIGRTDHKVTLFTRPRRFGKTLNMSMMERETACL